MFKAVLICVLSLYGFYCIGAELKVPTSNRQTISPPDCLDFANDHDFARMLHMSLGQQAYKNGDIEEALKCFEVVATHNKGTAEGMYFYGSLLLRTSKDTPKGKNFALGLDYLETAMNAGFVPAAHDLGIRYLKGDGVLKNLNKAKECFLKNSRTSPKERYHAGVLMYDNPLTSFELVEGLKLIVSSADDGYEFAQEIVEEDHLREELAKLLLAYRHDSGERVDNEQKPTLDYEMAKRSFK